MVGNLTLDDTFTPDQSFPSAPGGDALYSALGLRFWGLSAAILSRVGEDYPDEHLERMQQAGIDVTGIRRCPGPTVHYRVIYGTAEDRVFEHLTEPDRLDELSPTGSELDSIKGSRWVHVAAMPIERQGEVVGKARETGVGYSLDPHEEFVRGYEAQLRNLIYGAVFLPSELETGLLFSGLEIGEVMTRLNDLGARASAVKVGSSGSWVSDHGRTWQVPVLPVRLVDPTGAGDAYCGGFVAGFLMTGSVLAAAACGTASAGHIVTGFGAFHSPPPGDDWMRSSVTSLLKGRYDGEGDRALSLLGLS